MQESVLNAYGVVGFMYPGRDPARGRTVAQGSPAAQGSPVAHKSHGAVRLSVRSGNAQHYMLACVLLIIAGRNCVRGDVKIQQPRPSACRSLSPLAATES